MTVAELIEKLKEMPQDMEVGYEHYRQVLDFDSVTIKKIYNEHVYDDEDIEDLDDADRSSVSTMVVIS